jgi:hypothetical protein
LRLFNYNQEENETVASRRIAAAYSRFMLDIDDVTHYNTSILIRPEDGDLEKSRRQLLGRCRQTG